jgi:hypothetical protein
MGRGNGKILLIDSSKITPDAVYGFCAIEIVTARGIVLSDKVLVAE